MLYLTGLSKKDPRNDKPLEVDRLDYLRSLPKRERHTLSDLLTLIFADNLTRDLPIMALAVGTTTFPPEYWLGLRNYSLKSGDHSILTLVERRGEDLDIQLTQDICGFGDNTESWIRLIKKALDGKGMPYEFNANKGPSRVHYLSIPPKHQAEYGGKVVLRQKDVSYGPNFIIHPNDSRPIHLIFDNAVCGDAKLGYERHFNNPFSLLFRKSGYWELEKAVKLIEQQGELFPAQ